MNHLKLNLCVLCAILLGCAPEFNPDLGDLGSLGEDETSATSSMDEEEETSSGMGPDMGSMDEGDGDGDPTTGDGDPTGDGDGDPTGGDPVCGNGILEVGEECDGADFDFGASTCSEVLGSYTGDLGCWDDCTFDVSHCNIDGDMPTDGSKWSECHTQSPEELDFCGNNPTFPNVDDTCYYLIEDNGYESGYCSPQCMSDADCGAAATGTASAFCFLPLGATSSYCRLDCEDGRTCPDNMVCNLASGPYTNYCVPMG